ncbi:hypothetical protein [Pseudoclavibacter sp. VKM Ac-2867]|uniref:hypothetical protein n=1 Tax=Pseudoclavibacter sp. VKM Ac-2867 TaxID=2783829 RepID=UPI00188C3733|nr:hypothetical protein [Pseudoclavibacter sp. VKM Ac-2867]MBF4457431.1 hypothetical protein [Pseudoclavibacter sp. VKM Ac-2867]
MSSTRRPSKAVYRRRRLALLIVCVLVVGALVWGIASLFGTGSGDPGDAPTSTAPTASSTSTASSGDGGAAEATPTPTPTPTGPAECAAPELVVSAMLDAPNYAPDAQPQLSLSITNTGGEACVMNVGTAVQVYTISSGADVIWVSSHCQTDPADEIVTIGAGQSVTAPPITWVRERSSLDTCGTDRADAVAGGAYYQLVVSVNGIASQPATFVLD